MSASLAMEALRRLDHLSVALGVGFGAASVLACNAGASSSDLADFVRTGKKVRCCVCRASGDPHSARFAPAS